MTDLKKFAIIVKVPEVPKFEGGNPKEYREVRLNFFNEHSKDLRQLLGEMEISITNEAWLINSIEIQASEEQVQALEQSDLLERIEATRKIVPE